VCRSERITTLDNFGSKMWELVEKREKFRSIQLVLTYDDLRWCHKPCLTIDERASTICVV